MYQPRKGSPADREWPFRQARPDDWQPLPPDPADRVMVGYDQNDSIEFLPKLIHAYCKLFSSN